MTASPNCPLCRGGGTMEVWLKTPSGELAEIRYERCKCTFHPIMEEIETKEDWTRQ